MRKEQINIGYFDVPVNYQSFDEERKKKVCDSIIDVMLYQIEKFLSPEINRIEFLDEVFESSLITNEEEEQYEICQVIKDCRKRLNED